MADRVKSLKRVLAVQQQIVKIAEWRLNASKRKTAELKDDQARLREFVSGSDALSPLLSAAAFRRGQMLQGAVMRGDTMVASQTTHTDTMRRREKLAEKLLEKATSEQERAAEKQALQETIEAYASRDDASFP